MGRRTYSAQKIGHTRARLIANAGYVKPTAEAEEVSRHTVRRWAAGEYPPHVDPVEVERATVEESKELADLLSGLAKSSLEKCATLVGELKSARDAAITAAIAIDKMQLLRGRPTERTEVVDLASFLAGDRTHTATPHPPELLSEPEHVARPN